MAERRWFSIKEVADRFNVSHDTVARMVDRDELPAIRVSARLVRIPAAAVYRLERGAPATRRAVVRRRVAQGVKLGASESIATAAAAAR